MALQFSFRQLNHADEGLFRRAGGNDDRFERSRARPAFAAIACNQVDVAVAEPVETLLSLAGERGVAWRSIAYLSA